jgi:hypothetical protein
MRNSEVVIAGNIHLIKSYDQDWHDVDGQSCGIVQ